ncbi:MFS transporter [Actinoalloteichus hymeniacidonis]|uniref:Fucose permease n=1 Tax=Actinoalloteichus hymeniacidonis TaxID=340345 RepID=A0AAC9HPQ4_9PSEU|nr:MFS transporter [Actinoalloteichus hymeniacidonis]AOS63068.1 fucose permease [Actinoalloteichus hymeniacidonis]MBB5908896.1 fucose permease [Actinoalloteichus hymeniacidonis]
MPEMTMAALRRTRVAVAVLFFINAFAYANIVARFPQLKDHLELSNSAFGLGIAAMPAGALVAGLLAGPLSTRLGSGRLAVLAGVLLGVVVPTASLADLWLGFAATMFVLGAADSVMDAASNAHGIRVQRRYGRSVLNSFHGVWSLGAVCGGVAGSAAAGLGIPLGVHLIAIGIAVAVLAVSCLPLLLPGGEDSELAADRPQAGTPTTDATERDRTETGHVRRVLGLLGLVMMAACAVEDTPASWGAVLLRDSYAAPAALAGAAYVAFQGSMMVGRLLGDRMTDRFGHLRVGQAGGLLIAVPMAIALPIGSVPVLIVAFALAGLGTATLFPSAIHAAGSIPGIPSANAIAIVSWFARVGFLLMPPLIGMLADAVSLPTAMAVLPVFGLFLAWQSRIFDPVRLRRTVGD